MSCQSTFLWIGGTTRAGTTTLFDALSDHPQVCPSYIKQTCFFLDRSIQDSGLKSLLDPEHPERYMEFFRQQPDAPFLLDATPDYLYSPGTPDRLSNFARTKSAKCIFILRNPIDRFASWYSYGKQASLVPADMTWAEFMDRNAESLDYGSPNVPYLAKKTGRYCEYLNRFYQSFDRDDICVTYLESFAANANEELKTIARFAGLDASFFDDYEVQKRNANYAVRNETARSMYRRVRQVAVNLTYKNSLLFKLTHPLRKIASKAYKYANAEASTANPMPDKMVEELTQFYQGESARLEQLTGKAPPWKL